MARTVATAVEGILGDHYDSDNSPSLTPFIDTANALTTQVATCATARGVTLSSTTLELIERYLAAHFYSRSDPIASEKKTGDATAAFQGKTEMGLDSTHYGQDAKTLDHSGCLASMSKGRQATTEWIGRPPSEQTDYVNRD